MWAGNKGNFGTMVEVWLAYIAFIQNFINNQK